VRESAVQKQLLEKLNEFGLFFKPIVSGCVGFPDVFGVVLVESNEGDSIGIPVFVEVKRHTGSASDAQKYWLGKLKDNGAVTCICQGQPDDTINEIREQIHRLGYSIIGNR
jgi:hypothetical protein